MTGFVQHVTGRGRFCQVKLGRLQGLGRGNPASRQFETAAGMDQVIRAVPAGKPQRHHPYNAESVLWFLHPAVSIRPLQDNIPW